MFDLSRKAAFRGAPRAVLSVEAGPRVTGFVNFRQIETFVTIARLGSFRAAAEHLNSTQSTISVRMLELEQALGVVLFDRAARGASLTPKGRELIDKAEKVLALVGEMRLGAVGEEVSGVVRLGVTEVVAVTWLPRMVSNLRESFPKLTLEIEVALTTRLLAKLTSGEVDAAIVAKVGTDLS